MKKYLGHGGVGDCLMVMLKLLELDDKDFVYHHLNTNKPKLKMCGHLLKSFDIEFELLHCQDKAITWNHIKDNYDKCFNMYAQGKIDVPSRETLIESAGDDLIEQGRINLMFSNHWEACRDDGLKIPFASDIEPRGDYIVVQPIAGLEGERQNMKQYSRHWKHRPIIEYATKHAEENNKDIVWVGSEPFETSIGTNKCSKLSIKETLDVISSCSEFIGFNSVLLYWALYNKRKSHLFMDFQGRHDVRIHEEQKKYVTYIKS